MPSCHHAITPSLHHSITPVLHHRCPLKVGCSVFCLSFNVGSWMLNVGRSIRSSLPHSNTPSSVSVEGWVFGFLPFVQRWKLDVECWTLKKSKQMNFQHPTPNAQLPRMNIAHFILHCFISKADFSKFGCSIFLFFALRSTLDVES